MGILVLIFTNLSPLWPHLGDNDGAREKMLPNPERVWSSGPLESRIESFYTTKAVSVQYQLETFSGLQIALITTPKKPTNKPTLIFDFFFK